MTPAEPVAPLRSIEHPALRGAYGVADLPHLIEVVAALQPQRIAVRRGEAALTYAELGDALTASTRAMGAVPTSDALADFVVSGRLPGLPDTAASALSNVVSELLDDALTAAGDVLSPGLAPVETLATLFIEQVRRTPDVVAVEFDGRTLTYAQLDDHANMLARQLIRLGIGPDVRVGVAVPRSLELVIGIYAIHKAGGACVPIDPEHPADHIAAVLDVAEPALILTTTAGPSFGAIPVLPIDGSVAEHESVPAPEEVSRAHPDNVAYVIFTSGPTGRPEGVAVSHRAIVADLAWRDRRFRLRATDVVLQEAPFTTAASVWEFFWPLQIGARLVLAAPGRERDPSYLMRVIAEKRVTIAHFVPATLAAFVVAVSDAGAQDEIDSMRAIFASGAVLPAATAAALRAVSGAILRNLYGLVEVAMDVSAHEVTAADVHTVPIGVAADDAELLVLGDNLELLPDGVVGELYVSGVQLARGYLIRTALTAQRFVANPHGAPGDRMYRTGDLVRWNSNDGESRELEYLGRSGSGCSRANGGSNSARYLRVPLPQ